MTELASGPWKSERKSSRISQRFVEGEEKQWTLWKENHQVSDFTLSLWFQPFLHSPHLSQTPGIQHFTVNKKCKRFRMYTLMWKKIRKRMWCNGSNTWAEATSLHKSELWGGNNRSVPDKKDSYPANKKTVALDSEENILCCLFALSYSDLFLQI